MSNYYFITIQEYETLKIYENDHVYKAVERALVQQVGRTIAEHLMRKIMYKTLRELGTQNIADLTQCIVVR